MQTKRSLWPFGILTAFGLFIAGTAGLIVLASSQRVELVSPDYYEQEIRFQNHLDRVARTQQLAVGATVDYDAAARTIQISLPARGNVSGRIQLYRPSAAGLDRELKLDLNDAGVQSIDATELQHGLWKVRVTWNANGQEFFVEKKIVLTDRKIINRKS